MQRLLATSLLLALGCGGHTEAAGTSSSGSGGSSGAAPGSASCVYTETISIGGTSSSFTFCAEAAGLTTDQINALKITCAPHQPIADAGVTLDGMYSDGPCPSANRIGGCTLTSGGYTQTAWYYSGGALTADQIPDVCRSAGGTYISS